MVSFRSLGFAPPHTSSALFHLARRAEANTPPTLFPIVAGQSALQEMIEFQEKK